MGRLKGHMVYKIINTDFLPLRERKLHDPEEDSFLYLLKTWLKIGPMYFSYSLDITNSFQRQAQADPSVPMWKRADDRFFWNKFVQSDLIEFASNLDNRNNGRHGQQDGVDPFILPVMFGMMRIVPTQIKATPLTFTLITRRSRYRAGTRYFTRGIDEQGHVANFNETEQIVTLNEGNGHLGGFAGSDTLQNGKLGGNDGSDLQVLSFVQTRGSVPAFWAEINTLHYVPNLQVRAAETALDPARKHFDEQIRIYGDNYLVNLVNQKGRESRVKQAYEQVVENIVSSPSQATQGDQVTNEKFHLIEPGQRNQLYDRIHYVYFDFHHETKGLRWHRALVLLDRLGVQLSEGQYFRGVSLPGDSQGRLDIRNEQKNIVRTNCMDCLDRTNVVQTMLARWALTRQLTDVGALRLGETADDDEAFQFLFRNVWADNADVVSKAYSGTGALKTDFTRTGQRTRAGMVRDFTNSLTRYFTNNLLDGPKQDAFDLFLGVYRPSTSVISTQNVFKDRRPTFIQAVPYILAASIFLVLVSSLARPEPGTTTWPLRGFAILWMIIGSWSLRFIYNHGMLYVGTPLAGHSASQSY